MFLDVGAELLIFRLAKFLSFGSRDRLLLQLLLVVVFQVVRVELALVDKQETDVQNEEEKDNCGADRRLDLRREEHAENRLEDSGKELQGRGQRDERSDRVLLADHLSVTAHLLLLQFRTQADKSADEGTDQEWERCEGGIEQ